MIEKRKESTSIEKKISCEAIRLNTIKYNPVINTMVDVNRDGLDGWVDGWMGEWMDGWMNGWMDGWMDG